MKRRAVIMLLVALPLVVCAIGVGTYSASSASKFAWETSPLLEATPADVDMALRMAGITPEALAAAGVTGPGTSTLFQDASEHLNEALAALHAADAAYVSVRRDVDSLERAVVAGISTQEQRTALAAARTGLASAITSRTSALNGVFTAATANVSQERTAVLSTIRSNAPSWDQPVQYLSVSRTEAARVELREALAGVRIAAEQGVDPDQTAVNVVNTWNSDPTVAAATTSLSTNLAAVTAAWAEAIAR